MKTIKATNSTKGEPKIPNNGKTMKTILSSSSIKGGWVHKG
jgi:hypothetical protein